MFGPNAITTPAGPYFHHREPAYRALLTETTMLFRQQFSLPEAFWDVLFLSSSGTLANEAVLWSLTGTRIQVHGHGEFTERLKKLARAHNREKSGAVMPHYAMVRYETGESRLQQPDWPLGTAYLEGLRFADCVSSFPYFSPPPGADVWTTVSSKQLRAVPILSIVVVHRRAWKWLVDERRYSYLNLARYREFAARHESPHTPAIANLLDLRDRLETFNAEEARREIDDRRQMLNAIFPMAVRIGEGPVYTVEMDAIPEGMADDWALYRSAHGWQFFLYSGTDAEYEAFVHQYRRRSVA